MFLLQFIHWQFAIDMHIIENWQQYVDMSMRNAKANNMWKLTFHILAAIWSWCEQKTLQEWMNGKITYSLFCHKVIYIHA